VISIPCPPDTIYYRFKFQRLLRGPINHTEIESGLYIFIVNRIVVSNKIADDSRKYSSIAVAPRWSLNWIRKTNPSIISSLPSKNITLVIE
jgi:hypothetical protein